MSSTNTHIYIKNVVLISNFFKLLVRFDVSRLNARVNDPSNADKCLWPHFSSANTAVRFVFSGEYTQLLNINNTKQHHFCPLLLSFLHCIHIIMTPVWHRKERWGAHTHTHTQIRPLPHIRSVLTKHTVTVWHPHYVINTCGRVNSL